MHRTLTRLTFAAVVMLSLLYSTSWHALQVMPESSLNLDYHAIWQTSNVDGDARYYLLQADDFERSIAPYKYRVLTTFAVRAIHAATGRDFAWCYLLLNAACMALTGVLFVEYLMRYYPFGYPLALLGGVLAVTSVGMSSMMLLPMMEPATYLASLGVVWAVHSGNVKAFAVVSILAVMTKEIFILAAPLWIVAEIRRSRLASAGVRVDTGTQQGASVRRVLWGRFGGR